MAAAFHTGRANRNLLMGRAADADTRRNTAFRSTVQKKMRGGGGGFMGVLASVQEASMEEEAGSQEDSDGAARKRSGARRKKTASVRPQLLRRTGSEKVNGPADLAVREGAARRQ